MIYTVTFNPSLDYIVSVENFQLGLTNRTSSEMLLPGGKGINVSTVLMNLGIESTALGFTAGFTGDEIIRRLEEMGVRNGFIQVGEGFSRINLKLKSIDGTEINGQGPVIEHAHLEALMKKLDQLKAEVLRLKEFENQQVEFQRIQKEFYDEVVYSDKGPGAEEYKKYYESMDPATAEYIYKQVVTQLEESQEIQDYAAGYSAMKPKQAAAIFEQMTNNLDLAARILKVMSAEDRGKILGAMNSEVAAKITKIMDPES